MYWNIATFIPIATFLSYLGLLIAILASNPSGRLRRVFAFYLSSMSLWTFGSAMLHLNPPLLSSLFWSYVLGTGAALSIVAFYRFVRVFLRISSNQWLLYSGYAMCAVIALVMWLGYAVKEAAIVDGSLRFRAGWGLYLSYLYAYSYFGLSWALIVGALRTSRDLEQRTRLLYILIGTIVWGLAGLTNAVPTLASYPIDVAAGLFNAILTAIALFRHRLLGLEVIAAKGITYGLIASATVLSYILVFLLMSEMLRVELGLSSLASGLVVVLMMTVFLQPLREAMDWVIAKTFYREATRAQDIIRDFSQELVALLDLQHLTASLDETVRRAFGSTKMALLVKAPASRRYRDQGLPGLELQDNNPVISSLASGQATISLDDIERKPEFMQLWYQERQALRESGLALFAGLRRRGELVGVLGLGPKVSGQYYSRAQLELLATLANQAAVALANAGLMEELREQMESLKTTTAQLSQLQKVSQAIISSVNLREILDLVARGTVSEMGFRVAAIVLLDEDGKHCHLAALYPGDKSEDSGFEDAASEGPVIQMSQEMRKRIVEMFGDSKTLLDRPVVSAGMPPPLGSLFTAEAPSGLMGLAQCSFVVLAPLRVGRKVRGLLAAGSDEPIAEPIAESFAAISSQAATAIERSHHMEDLVKLEAAEGLSRAKSEFISTVSHELRSPLTILLGYGELLSQRTFSQAQVQEIAQDMHREADRMAVIVDDLLDISKIESGRFAIEKQETSLTSLINKAIQDFKLVSKKHRLIGELPENLPEVYADPNRINQVLNNLLDNAIKYSPEGGTVTVKASVQEASILVSVTDQGVGIPAAELSMIFEKFHRIQHRNDAEFIRGSGLGLAICKHIIETHRGRIWAESRLGKGSTFYFTIPV